MADLWLTTFVRGSRCGVTPQRHSITCVVSLNSSFAGSHSLTHSFARVLALVNVQVFIDSLFYTLVMPLLPVYTTRFKLSKVEVGALVGIFAGTQLAASPLSGYAADRHGPRRVLLVGLVALASASLAFAVADSYPLLLFARAVQGATASLTWTAYATARGISHLSIGFSCAHNNSPVLIGFDCRWLVCLICRCCVCVGLVFGLYD